MSEEEEKKITLKRWLWLLLSAILTGAGTAAAVVLAATTLSPQTFNDAAHWNFLLTLKLAGVAFVIGALGGAANFLQHSPLSAVTLNLLAASVAVLSLLSGCTTPTVRVPLGKWVTVAGYGVFWVEAGSETPAETPRWKLAPAAGRNEAGKAVLP